MNNKIWKVWDRDDSVEMRTYKRATGELPEMESAKQLTTLIGKVYKNEDAILDVGCAAGHYYRSLKKINENINYTGVDATKKYIEFANDTFRGTSANFQEGDIFNLRELSHSFDIVFCCNVILHLPDFKEPIKNLIDASRKYVFIRTLISERTLLAKYLYQDTFDEKGNPDNFVYQNTYSFDLIKNYIETLGDYAIEFINDEFEPSQINTEFNNYKEKQSAVTHVMGNKQVAGNLIFDWNWIKITKH